MSRSLQSRRAALVGTLGVVALSGGLLAVVPSGAAADAADAAAVPALNPCVPTDRGLPEVTSVSFSPTSVDVRQGPARVQVTVKVSDPGGPGAATGLASGQVTFANGGLYADLRVVDDQTMTGTVVIGRNRLPGKKSGPTQTRLDQVLIKDVAGNRTDLTGERLAAVTPVDTLQVTGDPDRTAPVISDLATSRRNLDARRGDNRVVFTARISDDRSDVQEPVVQIYSTEGGYSARVALEQVRGDLFRGTWRAPRWGTANVSGYRIASITAYDSSLSGRSPESERGTAWIRRQLGTDVLRVRSLVDTTAPRISDVRVSPTSIDLDGGPQLIVTRARVVDPQAPVSYVGLDEYTDFVFPGVAVRPRLISGDRHDGVWEARFMSRCSIPRERVDEGAGVWFADNAGSLRREYRTANHDLSVVLTGNKVNRVLYGVTGLPGGAVQVDLNRGVFNVTDASGRLEQADGTQIPGSWTACQNADGVAVSCIDGPVRRAIYTPTEPLASGAIVYLTLDPSGVLDLLSSQGVPPAYARSKVVVP